MKIRTDFVTNSSSSSFCITLKIIDKDDKIYSYCYNDGNNDEDSYTEYFNKSLRELNKKNINYDYNIIYDNEKCEKRNQLVNKIHIGSLVELRKKKNVEVFYNNEYIGYICDYTIEKKLKKLYSDYLREKCRCIVSYIYRTFDEEVNLYPIELSVTMYYPNAENKEYSIFGEGSVKELCELLTDNIYSSTEEYLEYDYDDEEELESFNESINRGKNKFITNVSKNIKDLKDIKKIVFERDYFAWGEFAELLADNDSELGEFAKKVVEANGEDKEKAKKEMLEYIKNVNLAENGVVVGGFGDGFSNVKYGIDDHFNLEYLASRLCSNQGPSSVSGYEYSEFDTETNEITEEAVFNLE